MATAAATATVAEPATVTLDLLDPGFFRTREDIGEFFADGDAGWVAHMIRIALFPCPENEVRPPAHWLNDARLGAWHLVGDLVELAKAGASQATAVTVERSERTLLASECEDYRRALAAILSFSDVRSSEHLAWVSIYLGGGSVDAEPAAEAPEPEPAAETDAEPEPGLPTERSTVALRIINPNRFPSRESVRGFVGGEAFGHLGDALSVCFCPAPVKSDSLVARGARDGAYFLTLDLFALAREAAQPDSAPFAVREDDEIAPARVRFITAIAALLGLADTREDIVGSVLDLADGLSTREPLDEAEAQA